MMKIKKIILPVVILSSFVCIAQQSTLSAGQTAIGSAGSVSYSIGQINYTTVISSSGSVSQGVQQAFEIYTLGTDDFKKISLSMLVYPNPTTSVITLKVEDLALENIEANLFDLNGRQLRIIKIKNMQTNINMANYPQGVYFLNISSNTNIIKEFKIIKN